MKIQHIEGSLTREERETHINCYYGDDGNLIWEAESSIQPHITKLKKAGWEQTGSLLSSTNGAEQAATFKSTHKQPISFRDLTKPKKEMSEEERRRRSEAFKAQLARKSK